MARPRKPLPARQEHPVSVRFTAEEHARLSALAERDKRTLADWIRVVALRELERQVESAPPTAPSD
jgi:hypothetical protein